VRNRTDVKFYLYFGRGTSRDAGGTPVEFWNVVYGRKKQPTCTWLHAFRACRTTVSRSSRSRRSARRRAARYPTRSSVGTRIVFSAMPEKYWNYVREKYWLKLKDHYPVSADLLGPRIAGAFP